MTMAETSRRPSHGAVTRRVRWRPLLSVAGSLGGALLGLSILVLIHQNGSIYPTRTVALTFVVTGAVLLGIVVPSLLRARAVAKARRRLRG